MGLNFRIEGDDFEVSARWSYSGFNNFRRYLAAAIGIDLEDMVGFSKKHPQDAGYIKIGYRSWNEVRSPLKYLLNHSGNDGHLLADQCAAIAPILESILDLAEMGYKIDIFDIENGEKLAIAMRRCVEIGKKLVFC